MPLLWEKGSFLYIPHEGENSGDNYLPAGSNPRVCGINWVLCPGGRMVNDGLVLLELIAQRKPWGIATRKLCFEANTYRPGQA